MSSDDGIIAVDDPPTPLVPRRPSLVGGAVSLLANTGVQSILGFAFAVLAAREFDADTVGRDLTVISVGRAISGICQLNLGPVLYRTLPVVTSPARLVMRIYALTVAAAVVLSALVIGVGSRFSGSLEEVADRPLVAAGFVAFVSFWTVYVLQDNALVSLHRARITPFESAAFGIATLCLLVIFYWVDLSFPVFWAFALPLPFVVVAINLYLFVRAIPLDLAGDVRRRPLALRRESGFITGDFLVSLLAHVERGVLPLVVVQSLGNASGAYFAAAYAISGAVRDGVASAIVPFSVELARRPDERSALIRQSVRWIVTFAVPACLVGAAASPIGLTIFGTEYREAATWLLVLLTASAAAGAVNALALHVARVDRRLRVLVAMALVHTFVLLVPTPLLIAEHGLVVIGIGYCVSEILALSIAVWYLRRPDPTSNLRP